MCDSFQPDLWLESLLIKMLMKIRKPFSWPYIILHKYDTRNLLSYWWAFRWLKQDKTISREMMVYFIKTHTKSSTRLPRNLLFLHSPQQP